MYAKSHPFYYHIGRDSTDKLSVKVTLSRLCKNVSTAPNHISILAEKQNKAKSGISVNSSVSNDNSSSCMMSDSVRVQISWQEKINGPSDIIAQYLNGSTKRRVLSTAIDPCVKLSSNPVSDNDSVAKASLNPALRIGELVKSEDNDRSRNAIHKFKDDMFVYTYVDKDFHIINNEDDYANNRFAQTSSSQNKIALPESHLKDAMKSLPAHNLHSRKTLSKAASNVHDRISREQPHKIMYIMAAVDCNIKELNKIATSAHSVDSEYENTDTQSSSDTLLLNQVQNNFHEEVLCVMKFNAKNDLLEVSPGFSTTEPEDFEDNRIFVTSPDGVNARSRDGARITTFRFTSKISGSMFEYTIERVGVMEDDFETVEEAVLAQIDEEYMLMEERRKSVFKKMSNVMKSINPGNEYNILSGRQEAIYIEIVSAENFPSPYSGIFNMTASTLAIQYDLSLSEGWEVTKYQHGHNDELEKILNEETGNNETSRECFGLTQQSKPIYYQQYSINIMGRTAIFFVVIFLEFVLLFEIDLALAFSSIVLLIVLGESISGYTSQGYCYSMSASYHFGHPIEVYREGQNQDNFHSKKEPVEKRPILFVQVCVKRCLDIVSVAGYGFLEVPTEPGRYDVDIPTLKPIAGGGTSELNYKLHDYYFGCAPNEFQYMKAYLLRPFLSSHDTSIKDKLENDLLNNHEMVTEGSGYIRVRIHVVSLSACEVNEHKAQGNSGGAKLPIFRETIDEVLSRVRRNKRERLMRELVTNEEVDIIKGRDKMLDGFDSGNSIQGTIDGNLMDKNRRTSKVLCRIRDRKVARGLE